MDGGLCKCYLSVSLKDLSGNFPCDRGPANQNECTYVTGTSRPCVPPGSGSSPSISSLPLLFFLFRQMYAQARQGREELPLHTH
jgi:hypothetical protein